MKSNLHPAVVLIKREISKGKHRYEDISVATGIPLQRLKNIMIGRIIMNMKERDLLCTYLDISPVILVMRREDLFDREKHLDLTGLPEGIRKSLIVLHNEICQLYKKKGKNE